MSEQFTPGPWETRGSGSIVSVDPSHPEEKIARCFGMTSPQMRADARLIAASPELLDAADDAKEAIEAACLSMVFDEPLSTFLHDTHEKLMNVLAKARGSQ